jgi:hypothetical protein
MLNSDIYEGHMSVFLSEKQLMFPNVTNVVK